MSRRLLTVVALFSFMEAVSASWLSQITGIDLDLNRGTLSVKTPDLGAIPEMVKNLPKDVGQAMLNPTGTALATAIRFSRGQALNRGTQQIPPSVRDALTPYFPAPILDKVRWTTVGGGITLDAILAQWLNQEGAVTLDDVIVFSNGTMSNDVALWAHELTHVLQYSQLGVESFAFQYTYNFSEFESQARRNASRVAQSISAQASTGNRTWGFEGQVAMASTQLQWSSVNQAARQAINPVQCIWIDNASNMTGNSCPVPIRVTAVIIQRLYDGFTFQSPCNEITCVFQPNQQGPLLSPPGTRIVGVTGAYQ